MAASARLAAIAIGFFSVVQADLTSASAVEPGDVIKDCEACPELIVVAAGSFVMGSDRRTTEGPPRAVIVERPFAIGRFEVTVRQWQACVAAGGCVDRSGESAGQHPDRPAGGLSWHDARLYVGWLSRTTGYRYQLTQEGRAFAVFYTKLGERILPPLFATERPNAPTQLRRALQAIDRCIRDSCRLAELQPTP